MNLMKGLTKSFQSLSLECRELYLASEVPVLTSIPSPLEFYRTYVSRNVPVIIQNGLKGWPAIDLWNPSYLREKIGEKQVTVAVTPNGYADAVVGEYFVMPEERTMKMSTFLDYLEDRAEKEVCYIQRQNSNFTDEFREIIEDAGIDIPWASEAFGKSPDAVNFWMGDERAITSMHKDHYENIYCVVRGTKTFTLIPPTDLPYITYGRYKPAMYKRNMLGDFEIQPLQTSNSNLVQEIEPQEKTNQIDENNDIDENDFTETDDCDPNISVVSQVPWVSVDPLSPDYQLYPDYSKTQPVTCAVQAGEILYLPSLWLHHVQQTHECIAVNYWYDMEYDVKYAYFKFLENLTALVKH